MHRWTWVIRTSSLLALVGCGDAELSPTGSTGHVATARAAEASGGGESSTTGEGGGEQSEGPTTGGGGEQGTSTTVLGTDGDGGESTDGGSDDGGESVYEPPCDTTREHRDAVRAQVIKRLVGSGAFSEVVTGSSDLLSDADPQGESIGYDFSGTKIGRLGLPIYNMPAVNDAILYLYCNPAAPGPAYWGTTPYLVSYTNAKPLEPNAEMGDSLNHLRLGSTAPSGELPWGYTSAIVTTPDEASAAVVSEALEMAGVSPDAINVQVIPSMLNERIKFGTDRTSSSFATGFRFRVWPDEDEAAAYAAYQEPVLYFLASGTQTPQPFATPARIPRGDGTTERGLDSAHEAVIQAAIQTAADQGFRYVGRATIAKSPIMDPANCLERFDEQPPLTCLQGSQDISYGGASVPTIRRGGMHLVVGAIHSRTGLAVYGSVGFGGDNVDTKNLAGSVDAWAPGVASAEDLFVLKVSRDCDASENGCLPYPLLGAPDYIERGVLQPSTTTGPAFEDLIPAAILRFEAM